MLSELRTQYNRAFSKDRFTAFLRELSDAYNYVIPFKIAETPVFIPGELKQALLAATEELISVLIRPDFKQHMQHALPQEFEVPGEDEHPLFLSIDFAVCKDESGALLPQLIELQGFPSLYFYQDWLAQAFQRHFPEIPNHFTYFWNGYTQDTYRHMLRDLIVADCDPANVILLEVDPHKQNTYIDFLCTEQALGITTVGISDLVKEGKNILYIKDGKKIPIHRIYNRVILDELLKKPECIRDFDLRDEVEVQWAGHPNWFYRISKYSLPFLKSRFVPESHFLHEIDPLPPDLDQYVLKPLYSFSGSGVQFHIDKAALLAIPDKHNYLLQRKVRYEPIIETLDVPAKCEIRMLCCWPKGAPRPLPVINLIRLSKGDMIGVKYNKDKTWVGGTVGFWE